MDVLLNIAVIWFVVGLLFFLLEFVLPGFILFFFGIGAWIVTVLSLFLDFSVNIQLIIFLASSVLASLLFRNWFKTKFGIDKKSPQVLEDEFIGKTAKAETFIGPGMNGKVYFKGTSWDAASDDTIAIGENVIISSTRSILLIVRSITSL